MVVESQKLEELKAFKCPDCGGSGRIVADWDALSQSSPYEASGLSRRIAERQRRAHKRAFADCGRCKGKGFILQSKD